MTSPAELNGMRWYSIGAVVGLLVGGLLVAGWHRSADGLSVTVLGAGRQASVLITSKHRRVLIAAGTNGAAFSNAMSGALPPIGNELDLVLIDPGASQDVQDRVRALNTELIWTLPEAGETATADTVERSFTVQFDDQAQLRIIIESNWLWHAEVESEAGRIVIAPDPSAIAGVASLASVVVATHRFAGAQSDIPLIVGVPGIATDAGVHVRVADPGSTVRLDLIDDGIRTEATQSRFVTKATAPSLSS